MKKKCPLAESIKYLEEREWSLGNGQCDECNGLGPKFYGHHEAKELGHERSCKFAKLLVDLGAFPIYKGAYPKTPEGEAYVARCKAHWTAMFKQIRS